MEIEKLKLEISKKPGIYRFVNLINGKSYIGQAVSLKRRFDSHITNYNNNRYDTPLYRAIRKYGFENFDYIIEECIEDILEKEHLKRKLDELEISYIKKYDSYNNGYNQTLGGDYGVLGYKMTSEQVEKIRRGSNKVHEDGRNTIYVYDKELNIILEFPTFRIATTSLNINYQSARNSNQKKTWYLKRYKFSRNKQELELLINGNNI